LLFAHDTDDDDALFLVDFVASTAPRLPPIAGAPAEFLEAALFFDEMLLDEVGGRVNG
jgi:hypothetical protein